MNQNQVKLIAIDMDGTLLDSQKEIPVENIQAIQEAAAAGIKIVLCTGRPRSGIEDLFQVSKDFPDVTLTLTGEKTYYVVGNEVPDLVAYDAGTVYMVAEAKSLEEIFAEGQVIFEAMYMAESKSLDDFQNAMEESLSQHYSTVRSQDYIFEIMPQGATKASGLKHLAEKLGIDPEQIMALGDAANDIEMLEFVGQSVAMGNASDDIKSLSKYVTLTNDQAGVAHAIRTWAL